MLGPRVKHNLLVSARKIRVKVESIAVKYRSLSHSVLELQMHSLQILQRARFKVKLLAESLSGERFLRVVSVKHWLLKLLIDGLLVQTAEV